MKTKTQTTQLRQMRDFDVAMMECANEFGSLVTDDILDEMAFAEMGENDDE